MDLVERLCDHVAIIADGTVRAAGTLAQVRGPGTLEQRFVELVGGMPLRAELPWLLS